jgi:hypothetical protein
MAALAVHKDNRNVRRIRAVIQSISDAVSRHLKIAGDEDMTDAGNIQNFVYNDGNTFARPPACSPQGALGA